MFRETTRDFLARWKCDSGWLTASASDDRDRSPTVLDLGCGPGFTTRLLADVFGAPVVGLDSSDSFLWEARRLRPTRVSFIHHDVTSCPFPTSAADLIFARFLVTHLDDPPTTVAEWSRQLTPSGRILLEEVENIRIEHPAFELYLRLVADSLERQGRSLYVGPQLDSGLGPALTVASSRVATLEVSDRDAARMFRLNLPTLRESGRVPEEYDVGALDRLQTDLDELAFGQPTSSHITWELRQIVLQGKNIDRPTTVS